MAVMTDERRVKLYDSLMDWIFDHCKDEDSYMMALDRIGFTKDEMQEELNLVMVWSTENDKK